MSQLAATARSLYRRILRVARDWQPEEVQRRDASVPAIASTSWPRAMRCGHPPHACHAQEQDYIRREAGNLFRERAAVSDPELIKQQVSCTTCL